MLLVIFFKKKVNLMFHLTLSDLGPFGYRVQKLLFKKM